MSACVRRNENPKDLKDQHDSKPQPRVPKPEAKKMNSEGRTQVLVTCVFGALGGGDRIHPENARKSG